jgi:hypothetical protein
MFSLSTLLFQLMTYPKYYSLKELTSHPEATVSASCTDESGKKRDNGGIDGTIEGLLSVHFNKGSFHSSHCQTCCTYLFFEFCSFDFLTAHVSQMLLVYHFTFIPYTKEYLQLFTPKEPRTRRSSRRSEESRRRGVKKKKEKRENQKSRLFISCELLIQ